MTATDELRRLLDERGVEWWYGFNEKSTVFDGEHDVRYEVDGILGLLFIRSALNVTPEQAIEATLGRETCRIVEERANDTDVYWEDTLVMECGAEFIWAGSDNPVYCPYCGRKVVE
jgi:hypothetical protein